jgi:hypothetical protein
MSLDNPQLIKAKEQVLKTKWVQDMIELQQENGSWGYFHSLNTAVKCPILTEQALRRLKILGLDYSDLCIKRAVSYMERYLQGLEDLPDRKEKTHDWTVFTHLMVAAQIRQFSPDNKSAMDIANKWREIIEYVFSTDVYDQKLYEEAYKETFLMKPKGGRLVDFVNFYPLTLLCGLLTEKTECNMLDYIINYTDGIYYIYEERLNTLPEKFASKQTSRYLSALELLSGYSCAKDKLSFAAEWLIDNIEKDGLWDMGTSIKDNLIYPISNSWRSPFNRKVDCTVRIMSLLAKCSLI